MVPVTLPPVFLLSFLALFGRPGSRANVLGPNRAPPPIQQSLARTS